MCFFSHGASFEPLDTLCSFFPGTKDLQVLEAMPKGNCLLDLKGMLSAERQSCSYEIQGSLGMSAASAFDAEFGECVSDGVLEGSHNSYQGPLSFSLHLQRTNQPPFKCLSTKCPGEQRGWHLGSSLSAPKDWFLFLLVLQSKTSFCMGKSSSGSS